MFTSTPVSRTRVRIQHADAVTAAGLRFAMQQRADIELCEGDLPTAGADADLTVCDYATGLALASASRQASAQLAPVRLLVLTDRDGEEQVRHALQNGVQGYLLCGTGVEELIRAVHAVGRGQRCLSPEVAQRMADSIARDALTSREAQVLQLLATGHDNRTISAQLGIAAGTVKSHVRCVLCKLGATSRTQAASIAAQRGLVVQGRGALH
jgi:DNA-binding NarL/FixJ family response regulator